MTPENAKVASYREIYQRTIMPTAFTQPVL